MKKIWQKSLASMVSAALCLTAFVGCLTVNAATTTYPGKITSKGVEVETTAKDATIELVVSPTLPEGVKGMAYTGLKVTTGYGTLTYAEVTSGKAYVETKTDPVTGESTDTPDIGEDGQFIVAANELETGVSSFTVSLTFTAENVTAGTTYPVNVEYLGSKDIGAADWDENAFTFDTTGVVGITVKEQQTVTHQVTFLDDEGKTLSSQTVNDGEAAVAPELPRKIGYSAAWDKDFSCINADTVVNATYTAATVTTKGIGAQLALESTFTFRFTFAKANYAGGTLLYAVVNKLVVDGQGKESYVEKVVEGEELFSYDNDTKMAFIYSGIAAKEMTSTITVQFYYELDGVLYSSKLGSTSVAKLTLSQIGKPTATTKLKTLGVDMLNYGATVQQYYGYRTNDLANEVVSATDDIKNYASYATVEDPVLTEITSATGSHSYGMGLSMNLTLGNTIDLNFLIKPGDYENSTGKVLRDTLEFRYSYTTTIGTEVNKVVPASEWADNGDGRYRYQFNVLAAKDLRTPVTVGIYDDSGNLVTKSATTSIAAYAAKLSDPKDVEVVKALFRYSDSAKANFS